MAKELPYFKFEPGQWDSGNIQLCSHDVQGVFINVCSMYWQRLGDLPYKLALQKVCGGNATALQSLCDEHVIKVTDGMICIDFLNEQLAEFEGTSKKNSENARARWDKSKKHATALRPESDRNAIRGEKRREEERKVDEKRGENVRDLEKEIFEDEVFIGELKRMFPDVDLKVAWRACKLHFEQQPRPPDAMWMWRQKLQTWASNDQHKHDEQRAKTKGRTGQITPAGNGQPRKKWDWNV